MYQTHNVGALVKTFAGVAPVFSAAATINGPAIDRMGYGSCVLQVQTGLDTGTPTTRSVIAKIQHSDDGSTNWTDLAVPVGGSFATTAITAVSTNAEVDVNLAGAKRYIRSVVTIAFTGGTTPTVGVSSTVVLGGLDKLPVT